MREETRVYMVGRYRNHAFRVVTKYNDAGIAYCRECRTLCGRRGQFYCSDVCRDISYKKSPVYGWPILRAEVLARDKLCRDCGVSEATDVHHLKQVVHHPELEFEPSNLLGLCFACHNERHGRIGKIQATTHLLEEFL
jgi:5-methylcytosine-specific restriction endonuclease McrA